MVSSDYYIADNSNMDEKRREAAANHYSKGNYSAALKLYLDMLNTSMSYKLYYEIGRCYYKLNDFLPSEEYFKKSVALESLKNPSYLYLGNIYFKREDLTNAIENWIKAYAYKPDDEAVCLNLATSYFTKGMKFQSVFYYEKYLKYAKNKGTSYLSIKNSIDKTKETSKEFLQKARNAISGKNSKATVEYLTFAEQNYPANFDVNYLLGKTYLQEGMSKNALKYLLQAFCIDNKSLDVLQNIASAYININDYASAYCTMRRLLPLILHNQSAYLKTIQSIKALGDNFDDISYQTHREIAEDLYNKNNYHLALYEYENCAILKEEVDDEVRNKIERLKTFIYPEARVIRICMEKGGHYYSNEDFRNSNKYFSRVMLLANEASSEYKLAKSRIVNV